jgi:hypothetical protein
MAIVMSFWEREEEATQCVQCPTDLKETIGHLHPTEGPPPEIPHLNSPTQFLDDPGVNNDHDDDRSLSEGVMPLEEQPPIPPTVPEGVVGQRSGHICKPTQRFAESQQQLAVFSSRGHQSKNVPQRSSSEGV